jgi:ABC-type sugar transport system ATPase subunit
MAASASDIAIEAVDVWKEFGHVQALRGASIAVRKGEIVGLVGDNGAGKSTLLKVMCGALVPDAGELTIVGRRVELDSTRDARELGVEVVYQDLALAPDLTILESVFLGHELLAGGWRHRLGVLSRRRMAAESKEALERLGIRLPSSSIKIQALSGGQRQAVAIARAVKWAENVILMDEPTAALGTRQTEIVVNTIRTAAEQGLGVLVISHDMPRMLELAHRIVVLRHGVVVDDLPAREATVSSIVFAMLGGTLMEHGNGRA